MIRTVTPADAAAIAALYNHYVLHTTVTFETEPVGEEEMRRRIVHISSRYPYLVEETDGHIAGYCYAHQWKEKEAYRLTAETTIYVAPSHQQKGIGHRLMDDLLDACRQQGLHSLIACITVPNEASVRLHLSLGFRQVSRFAEVGCKFGTWLDIYDFERIL